MASKVACYCCHNPETKNLPSSISNVINLTLIRQEFHHDHNHNHNHDDVMWRGPSSKAVTTVESRSINPYCEKCQEWLLRHLTMDLQLPYFSAELVVDHLRHLVHQKHIQLLRDPHPPVLFINRVHLQYRLNCYFERDDSETQSHTLGWSGPAERLVKITTADGIWAFYQAY